MPFVSFIACGEASFSKIVRLSFCCNLSVIVNQRETWIEESSFCDVFCVIQDGDYMYLMWAS